MYNCKLQHDVTNQAWIMCTLGVLLLSGSYFVRGVSLTPCGDDGVREVLADQDTVFTCTAEGQVQWRLQLDDTGDSEILATCEQTCDEMNNMNKLFNANIVNVPKSSSMTITAADPKEVVQLLNGSLQCLLVNETKRVASSRCNLSYVFSPDGVSCTAVNTSWSVTVSCVISSVYSSRGRYTCQLYRTKHGSKNETVKLINMVTTPTTERITNSEVKVSGVCQFNTTLPAEEGLYGFYVTISPGGQTYNAKFTVGFEWITNEVPLSPTVSCAPQPYVLENTNITCTCSTTSLGQPAGYLRWIVGNETNQATVSAKESKDYRPQEKETEYTHLLNLLDHEKTWFRCDVMWGQITIYGKNYTANVGYSARQPHLLLNSHERNVTVGEKEQVQLLCESKGRPTPNVSIYNNDNDSVIMTGWSPVTHTVIARCQDSASYTCSSWNEFSGHVTNSLSLNLDILCKPRSRLSNHLGEYIVHQQEVNFDIIANPAPHEHRVWFLRTPSNDNDSMETEVEGSMLRITCNTLTVRRYLSTCTLSFFNVMSLSTGLYKIQLTNEHGDENFTVVITFLRDFQQINPAVLPSVVGAILFFFTIVVLIGVLINRQKTKAKQRIHVKQAEANASISNPELCQTPLYAVVDKTKKKTNTHPDHIIDTDEKHEKGKEGLAQACESVYAVVDKKRSRSPGKCDNAPKLGKKIRLQTMKGLWKKVSLKEDSSYGYNEWSEYQNIVQKRSGQEEEPNKLDVRSPTSCSHQVDGGRRVNSVGLLYVHPCFDTSDDIKYHPPPPHDATEYCTLRMINKKFPAIDLKEESEY